MRAAILCLLLLTPPIHAGIDLDFEPWAEFPTQWRGFMLDQRTMRMLAQPRNAPPHPLRTLYRDERDRLQRLARERALTADETAELGGLLLRLGEIEPALRILRAGHERFPGHFRLAAHLGTAWQLQGDLDQAFLALKDALASAPPAHKPFTALHLKLVQGRRSRPRGETGLDDLLGVRYVGPDGQFAVGSVAPEERAKLTSEMVGRVQQLAFSLPADGRLLWQLAELANAFGDVRNAAALMDGCVTEFALGDPELRKRRNILRRAADELARSAPLARDPSHGEHAGHGPRLVFRSPRPLARALELRNLPPVRPEGINPLPWGLLHAITLDRQFKPTFPAPLRALDSLTVAMTGYLHPLTDGRETTGLIFLEFPVGCWFCEIPAPNAIVQLEFAPGQQAPLTRAQVKVTGKLRLNAVDPETYLITLADARIREPD